MDKTQKNIIDFMMIKTYDEIMFDVVTSWVLLDIAEIKNTLQLDKNFIKRMVEQHPVEKQAEVLVMIKDQAFYQIMQGAATKKQLIRLLDKFRKKKEETVHEVMRQYGLLKDSDFDYLFKKLCDLFDSNCNKVQEILSKGRYYELYGAELRQKH